MTIENKENIDSTNNEAEEVIENQDEGTQDENQEENNQGKPQETPEAKLARLKRQTQQLEKKLGLKDEPKSSKSNELDYGQKAFLTANGVKGTDEFKLVQEVMANTGKSLEDVLESKYFLAELNEIRELKASQNATPQGSKRSAQSSRDTVDYWLAKGELPPANEQELRRKVVNARIDKESKKGVFYNS